jgi:hypothetical protein
MINLDLEKQINSQIEQTIQSYLNSEQLQDAIKQQIDSYIGNILERVSNKIYNDIIEQNSLPNAVRLIVQDQTIQAVQQLATEQVRDKMSTISLVDIIKQTVQNQIDIKLDDVDFPEESINVSSIKWQKGSLNGSFIDGGMISNFSSVGIDDKAESVQLTVLDDHVVVENNFTAMNITAADTLTAKNLSLTGTLEIGTDILDHGPFSQMIQMHSQMIVDQSLEPYAELLNDGKLIVTSNALAPSISQSNLRKVGNLQELNVIGDAKFGETLYVSSNGRIGVNTDSPRGALTINDQDAEFTFIRSNKRTMFIGTTSNNNNIEIGTDNQAQISLSPNIIDISSPVRILGIKFSTSMSIPDQVGEPNELVFIINARDGQPIVYICRGGNKWSPLLRI